MFWVTVQAPGVLDIARTKLLSEVQETQVCWLCKIGSIVMLMVFEYFTGHCSFLFSFYICGYISFYVWRGFPKNVFGKKNLNKLLNSWLTTSSNRVSRLSLYVSVDTMVNPGGSAQPPPVGTGSLSWKRCAGCGGKIADRFLLYAMDSYWHSRCLKCSCCQAQLGEIGTSCYTKSGMILCRNDYIRLAALINLKITLTTIFTCLRNVFLSL